jgi:hypothetical protein
MCKGGQESYDEKEEDVLHGCGYGVILRRCAVSSAIARLVMRL